VAGPIERATHLLPQIQQKRDFNYSKAVNGLRQILWGFFKKVVIADQCAEYANMIFNNQAGHSGLSLLMGALFFTFQIYCDFSGYSDIALGTAKLFGIDLLRNFAFPYFSRDIAEFWRRWHISLSSWFRDYLYIPLGGSKGGTWMKVRNTFIIFIVSGFWHGANWTFIAWGTLNAIYFLPLLLTNKNRTHLEIVAQGRKLPTIKETLSMLSTFALTVLAWVFFRSDNFTKALYYLKNLFTGLFIKKSYTDSISFFNKHIGYSIVIFLMLFMIIEWIGREQQFAIEKIGLKWYRPIRLLFYYVIILTIIWFSGKEQQFIYFQF
jgi:hypothetical protein